MENRNRRVLAAGLATAGVLALGVGAAIGHDGTKDHSAKDHSAKGKSSSAAKGLANYSAQRTVTVRDRSTGEVLGMAMVRQRGQKLTAKISVAGLEPGSSHANHIHGEAPGARPKGCFAPGGHSKRHIHDFPNITANSAGVAYAAFTAKVDERVIRPGTFWMVHAYPEMHGHKAAASGESHAAMPGHSHGGHGSNPGIACAPIR